MYFINSIFKKKKLIVVLASQSFEQQCSTVYICEIHMFVHLSLSNSVCALFVFKHLYPDDYELSVMP